MIGWMILCAAVMWIGLAVAVLGQCREWPALQRAGGIVIAVGFAGLLLTAGFWLARNGG